MWQKSEKFAEICKIFENCRKILQIFKNFVVFWRILKIQPDNFVDLEKCRKMSIWLQKSVLIQPRTGLGKSAAGPNFSAGCEIGVGGDAPRSRQLQGGEQVAD